MTGYYTGLTTSAASQTKYSKGMSRREGCTGPPWCARCRVARAWLRWHTREGLAIEVLWPHTQEEGGVPLWCDGSGLVNFDQFGSC